VQGGFVPLVAARLRLPVEIREQEPWALGMRFRDEPHGLHRFTVASGSPADGSRMDALTLGENVWISFVGREGALVQLRGETTLQADDEVLVLADPQDADLVRRLFTQRAEL
jgi:potassium/hydrogen antiporter